VDADIFLEIFRETLKSFIFYERSILIGIFMAMEAAEAGVRGHYQV